MVYIKCITSVFHVFCGHVVHTSSALTVLVVQEVVSVDGPVLAIAVDNSYLTLPAEVFTNKDGPGIKFALCAHIATSVFVCHNNQVKALCILKARCSW